MWIDRVSCILGFISWGPHDDGQPNFTSGNDIDDQSHKSLLIGMDCMAMDDKLGKGNMLERKMRWKDVVSSL